MSPIVARLTKPRERRATSSGGYHHPTCTKRITSHRRTHRCGSQVASILGLENRATMGGSEEQRPPVETSHPTCIKRITLRWRTSRCGLQIASLARFGKPSDYVANSRSAFQAERAKSNVLRRTPITQRALNESRCIGGQTVAVYKSLRSLAIVARLSKPRERRATSSGGNHHPTCIKRITSHWRTNRCGSQVASLARFGKPSDYENRATIQATTIMRLTLRCGLFQFVAFAY